MSLTLPESTSAAAAWQVVDFLTLRLRTEPASGGRAAVETDQLDPHELWLIDHMVASCDSSTATRVRLYEGAEDPLWLLDGSDQGNFDVGDWPAGLQVGGASTLLVVWTGASNGARGVLTVQGRRLARG